MRTLLLLLSLSLAACGATADTSASLSGILAGDSGNLDAGFVPDVATLGNAADALPNVREKGEASAPTLEDAGDAGDAGDGDPPDAGPACVVYTSGVMCTWGVLSPLSRCGFGAGGGPYACCCP